MVLNYGVLLGASSATLYGRFSGFSKFIGDFWDR